MKLLGAALILCGAALQCHALLGARRQESAALRELSAALEGLERGIRASLMPLPRLLGQRGAGKYADAFFADVLAQLENGTPLPDGWREAAARTPLGEREHEVLRRGRGQHDGPTGLLVLGDGALRLFVELAFFLGDIVDAPLDLIAFLLFLLRLLFVILIFMGSICPIKMISLRMVGQESRLQKKLVRMI